MIALRIFTLLLAFLIALPCSLPRSAVAGVSPEKSGSLMNDSQAMRAKEELRQKNDQERSKAYQEGLKPAKPQKPLEIIIHGD